jgi:hypothetical protein
MWRPNSDRSDCNADRTSPGKQRCKRGASTLGLHWLWPVLVATQLLPWLPLLRVLPSSPLLASSSSPPLLLLMMITGSGAYELRYPPERVDEIFVKIGEQRYGDLNLIGCGCGQLIITRMTLSSGQAKRTVKGVAS